MRTITVPRDMTINLGYRKLFIEAGRRTYPDEVANHKAMMKLWDPEPVEAPSSVAPAPSTIAPQAEAPKPAPAPTVAP